ncbi:hypothetical protein [Sinorhizobium mexicanum]|uniref:Uncharacterized protein n=1 Tax=Sinorhizobium mexicanum TaxID=375549 RepID=A0A859QNC8_9HYPH|nr:hypothetical protein [Sinorhizobium mexicanum]MBP1885720.1 hypothetical protein [Sinorhizobium mexicanum]QLL63477.1 hypothetical protein FKV68_19530 [Sinorhizobium mexicanum]
MNDNLDGARTEVEKCWREFWDDHKDFDPPWVRGVLHDVVELLPFLFPFEAVREGVTTMYRESEGELPPDFDWTSADEDLPISSVEKLPIYRNYLAVRAYAFYGLKLEDADLGVHDWDAFHENEDLGMLPPSWLQDKEAKRAFAAARARQKLDHPEWHRIGLSVEELAALAAVSRKSIMNLLAPKSGGILKTRADGSISVESARQWLEARPDFRPSIWHLQEDLPLRRPDQTDFIDGDPVWVPVTKEGDWFSPEHMLPDGYFHVACTKYKQEKMIDDYWDALKFLSRAASPRWRCPDEAGRWYPRPASGWDRKTRQEIESLLEQTDE